MALIKVRVVVVVLIRRLTDLNMRDERSSQSNICLNVLKMRVAVAVAALLKIREVVLLKVRVVAL